MVLNPTFDALLDQRCDIFRPAETRVAGVTRKTLSAVSTGVKCHLQIRSRRERQMMYGQEDAGDHDAFFNSTADVALSDYVAVRAGPFAGSGFWVKGFVDDTDWPGIEHKTLDLALAQVSTAGVA